MFLDPIVSFLLSFIYLFLELYRIRLYQQGVLHVRFLQVVMACVFDPLLPGVCLHASCHTLFLDPIVSFLLSFIYLILELHYYITFIIICFLGYSEG